MPATPKGRPAPHARVHTPPAFQPRPVFVPAFGPVHPGRRSEVFDEVHAVPVPTRTGGIVYLGGVPHLPATAVDSRDGEGLLLIELPDGPAAWVRAAAAIAPADLAAA